MPNGPGIFHPAESAYARPGTYEAGLTAEATKQARYLSEMDKFYAQLEEMQTQFEKTHELALGRFEWEKEYGTKTLELKGEQIAATKALGFAQIAEQKAGRVSEESQFLSPYQEAAARGEGEGEEQWSPQDVLDLARGLEPQQEPTRGFGEGWGATGKTGTAGPSYYDPFDPSTEHLRVGR